MTVCFSLALGWCVLTCVIVLDKEEVCLEEYSKVIFDDLVAGLMARVNCNRVDVSVLASDQSSA